MSSFQKKLIQVGIPVGCSVRALTKMEMSVERDRGVKYVPTQSLTYNFYPQCTFLHFSTYLL